jgi:hypothetical protein
MKLLLFVTTGVEEYLYWCVTVLGMAKVNILWSVLFEYDIRYWRQEETKRLKRTPFQ